MSSGNSTIAILIGCLGIVACKMNQKEALMVSYFSILPDFFDFTGQNVRQSNDDTKILFVGLSRFGLVQLGNSSAAAFDESLGDFATREMRRVMFMRRGVEAPCLPDRSFLLGWSCLCIEHCIMRTRMGICLSQRIDH